MAVGTISCALISLACSFAYPQLTQYVIDEVIGQRRGDQLTWLMLGLIGAFLVRDLFNSVRIRLNNTFEQNVIYDMRREVYGKLQRLPVNYFDQRSSGDLMTRVLGLMAQSKGPSRS
jgi:ATP-binding cassette, subfamily B, bacterial